MNRKIYKQLGEVFDIEGWKVAVVPTNPRINPCAGCILEHSSKSMCGKYACSIPEREDGFSVRFIKYQEEVNDDNG